MPFFRLFSVDQRVRQRRLEVDDRPGRAEVGRRRGDDRLAPVERVQLVLVLVVADEARSAGCRSRSRSTTVDDVAAERVGVLPQLAVLQAERPDVVDVAVARDLGIDRLRRIGGRRREHERVGVEELRRGVVVRAEGELRLLAGRQVDAEQLLVAADARQVDERTAVRRPGRAGVGEVVLGDVGDLARSAGRRRRCRRRRPAAPAKATRRPSGEMSGDSGSSTVRMSMPLLDVAR